MPSAESSEAVPRPPVDWPRVAEGLQMAGLAVFLLLNTTGRLPWSFWLDAIALWPVLLMSAGLRVAFEKTRAPWALLLGPALVLGSLAWLATGNAAPEGAPGPWVEQSRPRPAGAARVHLRTQLTGARLSVATGALEAGRLVDVRVVDRTGGARVESGLQDDEAEVRLEGGGRQGVALAVPGRKQHWDVRLPAELPLRLDVHGVALRAALDLARGHVTDGRIDGVFLGVRLDLPATAQPVTLRFGGVFDALHVTVPEGTPVRVHGAGMPFNAVDRGVAGAAGHAGYDIKVEGVFTAVAVDTRPAAAKPEAEPAPGARSKPEMELPSAR